MNDISNISISSLDIETITEKSIIRLSTENDVKYIKFLGYGYRTDEDGNKPYRFVEYCFFEVPITDTKMKRAATINSTSVTVLLKKCSKPTANMTTEKRLRSSMSTTSTKIHPMGVMSCF